MKMVPVFSAAVLAAALYLGPTVSGDAVAMATDNGAAESEQPVTDSWITTKVKAELATTDGVKSMDISVETKNGIVTLTGVQPNDVAVKKAVATAQSIKGVKNVDASGLKSKD